MRGPVTLALFAASFGIVVPAVRAECHDCSSPCPSACSSPTVVNASAPNVIVEVPPPNVIIRASAPTECVERDCFVKRCCHFCRPICVQPAPAYSMQAPVMYQAAPVAAPVMYQPAPVAAPISFQAAPMSFQPAPVAAPISFQAAPMSFQAAPISFQAAPMSFQPAPVAAPISFQAAPISFQQAPIAAPVAYQLAPVAAAPTAAAPTAAPVSSESGMDCNQALRKITKEVETLTAAVDQHSDYLKIHEMRLLRIEDYLHSNPTAKDKPFDIITDLDKLKEATKDLPRSSPRRWIG